MLVITDGISLMLALLIKVWSKDQHHLGVCQKCRLSGPSPDLVSNLHFTKSPRQFICILKFEKHNCVKYISHFPQLLPVLARVST